MCLVLSDCMDPKLRFGRSKKGIGVSSCAGGYSFGFWGNWRFSDIILIDEHVPEKTLRSRLLPEGNPETMYLGV